MAVDTAYVIVHIAAWGILSLRYERVVMRTVTSVIGLILAPVPFVRSSRKRCRSTVFGSQ